MSSTDLNRSPGRSSPGVSLRTIAAVVIALLVLLFIVLNRDPTRISFIAFVAKAPLWSLWLWPPPEGSWPASCSAGAGTSDER